MQDLMDQSIVERVKLVDALMGALLHCTTTDDAFSLRRVVPADPVESGSGGSGGGGGGGGGGDDGTEQKWSTYVSKNRQLKTTEEVPIFLNWSEYATRTSTVVMYNSCMDVEYIDQQYDGTNVVNRRTIHQGVTQCRNINESPSCGNPNNCTKQGKM